MWVSFILIIAIKKKVLGARSALNKAKIILPQNDQHYKQFFFFLFFFNHPLSKHRKPSRRWIIYSQKCQKLHCFICMAFCKPAREGHTGGSIYPGPCCGAEVQFIHCTGLCWLALACLSWQDNAQWKLVGHLPCKTNTKASLTSAQSMVLCIHTGRHNIQITLISLSLSLSCLIRLSWAVKLLSSFFSFPLGPFWVGDYTTYWPTGVSTAPQTEYIMPTVYLPCWIAFFPLKLPTGHQRCAILHCIQWGNTQKPVF